MIKRYSALAIKSITSEYVIYEDEDSLKQKIALKQCSENWYDKYIGKETLLDKLLKKRKRCGYVADRCWDMHKAYFLFYSDIKVQFDFVLDKNMDLDDACEVRQYYWFIENQLRENGWFSFDIA